MIEALVRGDASALPFRDASFDLVVADPPYEGKNRGKRGVHYRQVGYVPFRSRDWWREAWRVLRPSGHLYLLCARRELRTWLTTIPEEPVDILSWVAPNNPCVAAYWRRGTPGRAPAWRPILHYTKAPLRRLMWQALPGPRINTMSGRPIGGAGLFVDPNVITASAIQSIMHEAQPWPNQLPEALVRYLLRPHRGARVLDLFCGTGTTRAAALGLGLAVVSVDRSPEALAITRGRAIQRGWALADQPTTDRPTAQAPLLDGAAT